MQHTIKDLLGNRPIWQFPLDKDTLYKLQKTNPSIIKNGFNSLYEFSIAKMKEAGVTFYSPGASPGRRFIYWFNSHFWTEGFGAPRFEKEEFIFKEVYSILLQQDTKTYENLADPADGEPRLIKLENGHILNELGREYLMLATEKSGFQVEFI